MTTETYDVLFNGCYGGFSFPQEFMEAVFEIYPPESELGRQLWDKVEIENFAWNDAEAEAYKANSKINHYYRVHGVEPFKHTYNRLVIESFVRDYKDKIFKMDRSPHVSDYVTQNISSGDLPVYYINYLDVDDGPWRTAPEIIAMARVQGLVDDPSPDKCSSSRIRTAKVPVGYKYEISEYDGKETVYKKSPYREIIGELVELYKTHDESKLGPLTRQLLDGTLMPNDI
jgi:hypothetical protein